MLLGGGGQQEQSNVPFATPQPQAPTPDPMSQPSPFFGQNASFGGRTNAINAQKNVS